VASLLGDAMSLLGDAMSSLGDAMSLLGDAMSLLGDAMSLLGDAKSTLMAAYRLVALTVLEERALVRRRSRSRWPVHIYP
jgi:hypothetical protein